MDYAADRTELSDNSQQAAQLNASARFSADWLAAAEQLVRKGADYKRDQALAAASSERTLTADDSISTRDTFSRDYGNGIISTRVLSKGDFKLEFPEGYHSTEDKRGTTTVTDRSGRIVARQSANGTLQVFTDKGIYLEKVLRAHDGSQGVLVTLDTSRKFPSHQEEKPRNVTPRPHEPAIIFVPDGKAPPRGYTDELPGINKFLRGR